MADAETIVVGGGIVGSSVAFHLTERGVPVRLIDRADPVRATAAGAGIVYPPLSGLVRDRQFSAFARRAAEHFRELDASLAVSDIGYSRPGMIAVAVDAAGGEEVQQLLAHVQAVSEQYGWPAEDTFGTMRPECARETYPALGEVAEAARFDSAGRVDGETLATTLQRSADGLERIRGDVSDIRIEGGAVGGVRLASGEEYASANVVIAGGAWSGAFADSLEVPIPVRAQRGQIIHVDVGGCEFSRPTGEWPILQAIHGEYQVPWPGGQVAIGATRENNAPAVESLTVGGMHDLSSETLRVTPKLTEATVSEMKVGMRPVSPDGRPILGESPAIAGAFIATGHGPSGLTFGPYSGKLVAQLVCDGESEVDVSEFAPSRFGGGD